MKLLYAPWRSQYITKRDNDSESCPFCFQFAEQNDEHNFILRRYEFCALMLNLHPYNAGHLLIVPYAHASNLYNLSIETRHELIEVASTGSQLLESTLACQAVNIGINIGKEAGGSLPEHIHVHSIPRWTGDTNFLAAIAQTKPISIDLHTIYDKLRNALHKQI